MTLIDKVKIAFLIAFAVITCGSIVYHHDKKAEKTLENAQRYAREHNTKCYGSKYSTVFVFGDYSVIGEDVMYSYYD